MGNESGTNFVTDSGQFYDTVYYDGTPEAVTSKFRNAEQAWQVRRAKVIQIEIYFLVKGETGTWVLWQGDDDIDPTTFDAPDEVRNDDRHCVPLTGGVIGRGFPQFQIIRPTNRWVGSEEQITLCVNPTLGLCEMFLSIHTLYMIGGS